MRKPNQAQGGSLQLFSMKKLFTHSRMANERRVPLTSVAHGAYRLDLLFDVMYVESCDVMGIPSRPASLGPASDSASITIGRIHDSRLWFSDLQVMLKAGSRPTCTWLATWPTILARSSRGIRYLRLPAWP